MDVSNAANIARFFILLPSAVSLIGTSLAKMNPIQARPNFQLKKFDSMRMYFNPDDYSAESIQEKKIAHDGSWYSVGDIKSFPKYRSIQTDLGGCDDVVFWIDKRGVCHALKNVCPHAGAPFKDDSLDGKVFVMEDKSCIECPYHGLRYIEETGENIKNPNGLSFPKSKTPVYETAVEDGLIYIRRKPENIFSSHDSTDLLQDKVVEFAKSKKLQNSVSQFTMYEIPELFAKPVSEPDRAISTVSCKVQCGIKEAVENLADTLHISYIHSFGNRNTPLPNEVIIDKAVNGNPNHLRQSCVYIPGPNSLFTQAFGASQIKLDINVLLVAPTIALVLIKKQHGDDLSLTVRAAVGVIDEDTVKIEATFSEKMFASFLPPYLYSIIKNGVETFLSHIGEKTLLEDAIILNRLPKNFKRAYLKPSEDFMKLVAKRMKAQQREFSES